VAIYLDLEQLTILKQRVTYDIDMFHLNRFTGSVLLMALVFLAVAQSASEMRNLLVGKNGKRWAVNKRTVSLGGCAPGETIYVFRKDGSMAMRECSDGHWLEKKDKWSLVPEKDNQQDWKITFLGSEKRITFFEPRGKEPGHFILTVPDLTKPGATKEEVLYELK
jgi:hypothetical protein